MANWRYLVIKTVSRQSDDTRRGVQGKGVHAPVRDEGVGDGAGGWPSVEVDGLDPADDGAAFGVFENVERKRRRLKSRRVVVHVLDLESDIITK